jgi:hypothetical protein
LARSPLEASLLQPQIRALRRRQLRGVTALEFRPVPLTHTYAGVLWYPIERRPGGLPAWAELTRGGLPDELTMVASFLKPSADRVIPKQIRGKSS